MDAEGQTDWVLVCSSGQRRLALPLPIVRESMRPLPVDSMAGLPPYVLGTAVIRGIPTPVIDVEQLLDGAVPGTRPDSGGRFVTLEGKSGIVALQVDAVLGVRARHALGSVPLPPLLRDAAAQSLGELAALDGQLLLMLQTAHLLPAAAWAQSQ